MFRWLGWALLYPLTLWDLWSSAAVLATLPRDQRKTRWVWITAILVPSGLALIGAPAAESSWWIAIPPLVIGLSLPALTVAAWQTPWFAREAGAAGVLMLILGKGTENTVVLILLDLTALAPPLALGLAWVGLTMSTSLGEPRRGMIRGFAR